MSNLSEAQERIEELEEELQAPVIAIEANCAHIAIEWREIGGIRIGLDAAGTAVRVEIDDNLTGMYGWAADRE